MSHPDIQGIDTCDFCSYEQLLTDEEGQLLYEVRKFMASDMAPVLLKHWSRATFPFEIVPGVRELGIAGQPTSVRPANRRIPTGPGFAGADARQRHLLLRTMCAAVAAAG